MSATPNKGAPREVGADGKLIVNGTAYGVTNASYSLDVETSDAQFSQTENRGKEAALRPSTAVTAVSATGSFEHEGDNAELRSALITDKGIPKGVLSGDRVWLEVEGKDEDWRFRKMIVTSRAKDQPTGDRTSVTYDWTAEVAKPK